MVGILIEISYFYLSQALELMANFFSLAITTEPKSELCKQRVDQQRISGDLKNRETKRKGEMRDSSKCFISTNKIY